jgi:hypothetical protein
MSSLPWLSDKILSVRVVIRGRGVYGSRRSNGEAGSQS